MSKSVIVLFALTRSLHGDTVGHSGQGIRGLCCDQGSVSMTDRSLSEVAYQ